MNKDTNDIKEQPSKSQVTEEKVIGVIKTCYDPEIPVNIYELGLIYQIKVDTGNKVHVLMTLTSPTCPVADALIGDVEKKVRSLEGVSEAKVELTFDPPWTQELMSESAKLELGFM